MLPVDVTRSGCDSGPEDVGDDRPAVRLGLSLVSGLGDRSGSDGERVHRRRGSRAPRKTREARTRGACRCRCAIVGDRPPAPGALASQRRGSRKGLIARCGATGHTGRYAVVARCERNSVHGQWRDVCDARGRNVITWESVQERFRREALGATP